MNFDGDEDLAWLDYLTDVGTANTAYDTSVDPAWTLYDGQLTTANSDYQTDRSTADGLFQNGPVAGQQQLRTGR